MVVVSLLGVKVSVCSVEWRGRTGKGDEVEVI